jgi:hypothetical protein
MEDTKAANNYVSKDPAKDLEMDQAFGIPALLPQAPMATLVNTDAAVMLEMQRQQQQMAAFQVMGGMVNPAMALGGLNPALLQHAVTTPISNYLASNSQVNTGTKEKGGKKKKVTTMEL